MVSKRVLEKWERVMENPCVRCVLLSPKDHSICSDCASSHSRDRAIEAIERAKRETGYSLTLSYKNGVETWRFQRVGKKNE